MNNTTARRPSFNAAHTRATRVASAILLLASVTASAAQAQSTQLTGPPAGSSATITNTYPTGDSRGFITGPFTVAAGNTNVMYTATQTVSGMPSFESFSNFDSSLDFPTNTQLVDTFDGQQATGPLLINFSTGVPSFSIKAEDNAADDETFTFTVTTGTIATTFVTPTTDNTMGSGKSIFLGAQSTGANLITSVLISSKSTLPDPNGVPTDTGNSNDFYVGPLSLYSTAAVPEASTTVSFGLLLALGLGGICVRKQRGVQKTTATT